MTLQEALILKASCDLDKDDCKGCPLSAEIWLDVGEMGHFRTNPCHLLLTAKMVIEPLPFPNRIPA